jgi:DNA-binding NarL/FixJ family response regulator
VGAALRLGIKLLTICGYDFPKPFGDLRVQLMEGSLNAFPIRVLLVDDFKPWHGVISATLQKQPELQVIGQVFDGFNAVQQAQELQPDLILLDIGLPTLNGIEAARQIGEVSPNSKILFVSENRSPDIAEEALRTGASGYVVKSDVANELLPAIGAVLEGKHFLSISLADRVSLDLTQRPAEQPV